MLPTGSTTTPAYSERLHIAEADWRERLAGLDEPAQQKLKRVRAALPLAADVSRADALLLFASEPEHIVVAVHAQPHSMTTLFLDSPAGQHLAAGERRWLWDALNGRVRAQRKVPEELHRRPEVHQTVLPVLGVDGRPLAAISIFTNVLEFERHRTRDATFRRALVRFQQMVADGDVLVSAEIPGFFEQDGILFIDNAARYRYLSGQAANVYRRLGHVDDLRGLTLDEVEAGDLDLVHRAWETGACVYEEADIRGLILQRTAIPLKGAPDYPHARRRWSLWRSADERYGALVLVKDITEQRLKAQQLRVRAMMLKEVHHRVKNNLQMLLSTMRMQGRRAQTEEARQLLAEASHRILSMSVVHEVLSEGEDQSLNLSDLVKRLAGQVQQATSDPTTSIRVERADPIILPTKEATACAMVVNELILNAVEHGVAERSNGHVWVNLYDEGPNALIEVADDGRGLPPDFSLAANPSLGLDIVRTLVQDDLRGSFELQSRSEGGTLAAVRFPIGPPGGRR